MAERVKMPQRERAKQFMPFDTLKGLHDALRMKEYEHERVVKGELSEEKAAEISKILLNLSKNDIISVKFYENEHYVELHGKPSLHIEEHYLEIDYKKIYFDDIYDLKKLN